MRFYVIEETWWNGEQYEEAQYDTVALGVFESLEKAEEQLNELFARHSTVYGYPGKFVKDEHSINSWDWVYDRDDDDFLPRYSYVIKEFVLNDLNKGLLESFEGA